MPGLVTRIGQWIDSRWEDKATQRDMIERTERLERMIKSLADSDATKEIADLKTRIEKMELYTGMTRKVDPTKGAVAKSAFAM